MRNRSSSAYRLADWASGPDGSVRSGPRSTSAWLPSRGHAPAQACLTGARWSAQRAATAGSGETVSRGAGPGPTRARPVPMASAAPLPADHQSSALRNSRSWPPCLRALVTRSQQQPEVCERARKPDGECIFERHDVALMHDGERLSPARGAEAPVRPGTLVQVEQRGGV